jgi:thioredoxin reductase (NADPH)
MSEHVTEIQSADFQSEIRMAKYTVVDFYSTECPPCEALAPKYEYFANLYGRDARFLKIYRQGNRELASELGVKSSPTVLFFRDGKETGNRLSGAILKSNLKQELLAAFGLTDLTGNSPRETIHCDIAILGGGPAGLAAAVYAARAKLKTMVLDKGTPGGYVNVTHSVANYPGTGKELNGYMLGHLMTEQAKQNSAIVHMAVEPESIDLGKKEILADGDKLIRARAIIIATGSRPRPLNIPGESEFQGKGLSYCATCDGGFYEGKEILVIGGGNSALEESEYLTRFVSGLTIVHQFDDFQANQKAVETVRNNPKIRFLLSHEPRRFTGNGRLTGAEVEDLKTGLRKTLSADGIFVFAGFSPNTAGLDGNLSRDRYGYLVTDENMATNIPGVYAAGDVRSKKYRQITTAVSDGTIAALEAEKWVKAMEG